MGTIEDEAIERLKMLEESKALWSEWINTPEGKAQEKLHDALLDLSLDPEISESELCSDFLRVVQHIQPGSRLEADSIFDLISPLNEYFKKTRAVKNADRRHAAGRAARAFVESEWTKNRAGYSNNKSAFARDYSRRVKNELGTDVTEKTIREVWLVDTPDASKQAG
jgi:hypothetical protein